MEDIVKRIVLKFSTEGQTNVERAVRNLSQVFNARESERFLRNLEMLQTKMGRFGQSFGDNLQKINQYFRELNEQQFKRTERNIERVGRLLEAQIKNLQKLQEGGAAPEVIQRQIHTMQRTARRFEELAQEMPYGQPAGITPAGVLRMASGNVPGTAGLVVGGLNISGMVSQAVGQAFAFHREYLERVTQNTTAIANVFKRQTWDILQGDMSRAVLYSDPRRAQAIREETRALTRSKTIEEGAKGIGSLLLGTAALIGGGALAFGTGGIGAGVGAGIAKWGLGLLAGGGGAYLLQSGARGLRDYFFAGGREAYETEMRMRAEEKAMARTLDVDLYREFARRAPLRHEYQRLYRLGDEAALQFRRQMRDAMVLREEEMFQLMEQFRRFGVQRSPIEAARPLTFGGIQASGAPGMAWGTALLAERFGIGRQAVAESMQRIAELGRGGAADAVNTLERVLTNAVRKGVSDAGLEEFLKSTANLIQLTGGRLSTEEVLRQLNQFLVQSPDQYRAIHAMPVGLQAAGQVMHGVSPLMQAVKTAHLVDLTRGQQGDVDMLTFQYLESLSPERLATLTVDDPVIQAAMRRGGISREEMEQRLRKMRRAMIQGTLRTTFAPQEAESIMQRIQEGGELDEGELRRLAIGLGLTQIATTGRPEELLSALKPMLEGYGITRPLQMRDAEGRLLTTETPTRTEEEVLKELEGIKGLQEGLAARKALMAQKEGEEILDLKMQERVVAVMDDVMQIFKEQMSATIQKIDEGILSEPLEKIVDAADRIAGAMQAAATRIESALQNNETDRNTAAGITNSARSFINNIFQKAQPQKKAE